MELFHQIFSGFSTGIYFVISI